MTSLPISCFIIALNEADRIAATIESVRGLVSEIVVIDSGSTDGTQAVAEAAGARVLHHDWPGYGLQKRYGEEQCRQDWLLNLDADEIMSEALAQEIRTLFRHGPPAQTGYLLRVRDLLPGEQKPSPFAHTNAVLRLYDRRKARFSDSPVHDSVIAEAGEVSTLVHPVLHRSFRSLTHAIEKMNAYTSAQAKDLQQRGKRVAGWRLWVEFPIMFLKAYLLRGYALRGTRGFVYALYYAFGRTIRLAKRWEMD